MYIYIYVCIYIYMCVCVKSGEDFPIHVFCHGMAWHFFRQAAAGA